MKRLVIAALLPLALFPIACSDGIKTSAPETKVNLIGNWQSMDDASYVLKLDMETYREFYENEEMSRDQWQAVDSCETLKPVEKTTPTYEGFQIWTKDTDSRICYTISDWAADKVSLTYAGTTSSYTRLN